MAPSHLPHSVLHQRRQSQPAAKLEVTRTRLTKMRMRNTTRRRARGQGLQRGIRRGQFYGEGDGGYDDREIGF